LNVLIRRAYKAFEVERSTYHYKPRRTDQAVLEARIKEICQTRVRYGYRRIHVMLQRDGWKVNQNSRTKPLGSKSLRDNAINAIWTLNRTK
jgi:putative transposase